MGFTCLKKTPLLSTIIATLFLSACSGTPEEPSDEVEVKSINIFFSKENEAGADVGKAYSFSPSTGRTVELATINHAPDSIATLDTDEDAPGYEFAAFAHERTVKLLDYSKTATQRVYDLQTFNSDICGVYPAKRPAYTAYDRDSDYYLKTIDDTATYIALKEGSDCSRATDSYHYINFNAPDYPTVAVSRETVTSAEVFGSFLFDPSYRTTNDDNELVVGRAIWVGHNKDTESLSGKTWNGQTIFDLPFAYKSESRPSSSPETPPPFIIQTQSSEVLIQKNSRSYNQAGQLLDSSASLYKLSLASVKAVERASTNSDIHQSLSNEISTFTLSHQNDVVTHAFSEGYFVYESDEAIYSLRNNADKAEIVYVKENSLTDIKFAALNSGKVAIAKTFPTYESLHIIDSDNSAGITPPVINTANKIDIKTDGTSIYVNALAPSKIEDITFNTQAWVAARLDTDRGEVHSSFEGAKLIFLDNPLGKGEIVIISSSEPTTQSELISPIVAKFDPSRFNGIYSYKTFIEGSDEELSELTQIIIGSIADNVIETTNKQKGANFLLNQQFSGFQVKTNTGTDGYYFSPEQSTDTNSSRKPSLSLIKSSSLTNSNTINFTTVTEEKNSVSLDI